MLHLVRCLVTILFASRAKLAAENLALRHQLGVLGRSVKRPRLRKRDRIFWVWLSKLWPGWRAALVVVKPATVVAWHRKGFKLYWRWKSRKHGRPKIDAEVRTLIRRMSEENPLWGVPRIQAELKMLGVDVAESTIAKYVVTQPSGPPSQTWRTFLANHLDCTAACDFFVVPTSTFRLLYAFVVLSHCRREIVHVNVTAHPTAAWAAQQVVEAFPWRRHRTSLPDSGSRFDLRHDILGPRREHAYRAGDHVLPLALAKRVRRACESARFAGSVRITSSRSANHSCEDCCEATSTYYNRIPLPHGPGWRRAAAPRPTRKYRWSGRRDAAGRRAASSVRQGRLNIFAPVLSHIQSVLELYGLGACFAALPVLAVANFAI